MYPAELLEGLYALQFVRPWRLFIACVHPPFVSSRLALSMDPNDTSLPHTTECKDPLGLLGDGWKAAWAVTPQFVVVVWWGRKRTFPSRTLLVRRRILSFYSTRGWAGVESKGMAGIICAVRG